MIQIIYQPDRNVPFDCGRKLPKNRPVRHEGRRRAGRGRPDREGGVCLRGANTAGEGAHAGLFYSKIPAIFEELS